MNTKKHLFFVFALLTMILVACKPETDVKHTVTYKDSQLKTLDTHIVQSGNTDIPPATNEEKEGLDFIGWSLDENGEKLFDFNTPITSDITLYPIWEVNALYKSKSFEVRFIYYDQEPITTRTYKTGNRISISNLGFNDKIYSLELIDESTGNQYPLSQPLSYKASGYTFVCHITSSIITIDQNGTIKGTEELKDIKKPYELVIPRLLNNYVPKSIGDSAFEDSSNITAITLPESIVHIGNNAFKSCTSLKSINIPDNTTFIGEEAFKSCTSLGSITIPGGVSKIGDSAFNNCWMLSSVTLNDGIETIGDYSFSGCSMITTIKIPGTVASIGDDSFYNCRLLSEITIDTESTTPPGGVLPWGGYEYYDNGEKYKALTIKNANGYVFFKSNVQ